MKERVRERESVCERERESVCVRERERKREREKPSKLGIRLDVGNQTDGSILIYRFLLARLHSTHFIILLN